jgi:hypothetical protein
MIFPERREAVTTDLNGPAGDPGGMKINFRNPLCVSAPLREFHSSRWDAEALR